MAYVNWHNFCHTQNLSNSGWIPQIILQKKSIKNLPIKSRFKKIPSKITLKVAKKKLKKIQSLSFTLLMLVIDFWSLYFVISVPKLDFLHAVSFAVDDDDVVPTCENVCSHSPQQSFGLVVYDERFILFPVFIFLFLSHPINFLMLFFFCCCYFMEVLQI